MEKHMLHVMTERFTALYPKARAFINAINNRIFVFWMNYPFKKPNCFNIGDNKKHFLSTKSSY